MTETEKLTKQRNLVAAAFNAIESKSVSLAMKAEDDEKRQADAFGLGRKLSYGAVYVTPILHKLLALQSRFLSGLMFLRA
ncbi:hypothetical protein GKC33_01200 [Lactobacillus salivarius]|uniref:Uncharacterized protein n=1 Tax=Ligilactobacillus salivarius TaxID=1624 RepID=A0A6A8LQX8_9LACO|nr:hypothetical protein [Ligilactobacillus salivarius]MSE07380.1 hypothetical protein [Ligilactobacillus salivarius]